MPSEQNTTERSHDARITALEVGVKAIHTNISDLKSDVDNQFEHLQNTLSRISSDLSLSGRTDWKSYMAGLAVLLVIIGMIGNGYVRDQERTEDDVGILQAKFHQHDAANGIHYSLREQVLNNKKTTIDNLRTHEQEVQKIESDISKIRDWQEKHAERAGQSHTRSDERLKSLERQLKWSE